ncbi:hypothetical protein HD554DRAFT_2310957 [Boletus coccyginus]|nr:hypothetical protein HD554DRAFT_2310957 [Boletus coccyginus]
MTRTSQDRHRPVLNQFAGEVWGNPGAILKQHPGGFQFIDLGPYFKAFRSFFAGVSLKDKILVRDEYRTALQALKEDQLYEGGAYVVGQPGIGKTFFLVYVLVTMLNSTSLTTRNPYINAPSCGSLCDSNQYVKIPSPIFLNKEDHIRVIQTTSPKPSRWKEWSKQAGISAYVMDNFSDEEVVHLATLLGLDVPRMATLSRNWGNVPRRLLKYINMEDSIVEGLYHDDASPAVQKCKSMIDGGSQFNFPDNPPSSFYFLRPMKTDTGAVSRVRGSIHVPTRALCRLLAEALQDQDNHVKLQFYNALSYHGNTRKRRMDCHWVVPGSGDDADPSTLSMPAHAKLIPPTKTAPGSAIPPYYWIAYKPNFAGIDSVLVLEDRIFAFQMTLSSDHRSPIPGLRDLRKLLPHDRKDIPWRVVFVGPEEGPIETVAARWNGELSFPTKHDLMPVGWSALDPAQRGVIYKEPEELSMEVDDEGGAGANTN